MKRMIAILLAVFATSALSLPAFADDSQASCKWGPGQCSGVAKSLIAEEDE